MFFVWNIGIRDPRNGKTIKIISLTENKLINKKLVGILPELNTDKAFKKTDVIKIKLHDNEK